MGGSDYKDPQTQAALHTRVLQQSKSVALAAFSNLPRIGKPSLPYMQIMQKPGQTFIEFVDKVTKALDAAPNITPDMKPVLLKDLVTKNARQKTISEMLEMAGKVNQRSQTQAVAEAFTAIVRPAEKHLATMVQKVVKSRKSLSISLAFVSYLVAMQNHVLWYKNFNPQADENAIEHWSHTSNLLASVFAPVGVDRALRLIRMLNY
ncbi:hypothetical protein WISP_43630 [Willisornis vidua]|uniref:Uncharacterized protein n=1 Tax=Willisornis vidua TaxID=1566151 RepID=A0ABQ9DG06_9PASS|nr:hypothetical protein WISP_43630 [Willisornis vidua]